jgi:methylglutaconyl-CoA hydratase
MDNQPLLYKTHQHVATITFNRPEKHNAFDDALLLQLQDYLETAIESTSIRVIVINANGAHFSAGADIAWMKRIANLSEEDNEADALVLAKVMYTLHHSPKPTITQIRGCAYGGGAGIAAASDITIACASARFCFSEVKLGLIPAVISPYVLKAIGERNAKALFMSGEPFDAIRAQELGLVHHVRRSSKQWPINP